MQAACATTSVAVRASVLKGARTVRAAPVAAVAKRDFAAVAAAVTALVQAHPALALVDERLNGDGTGKVLGVDNSAEAFAFIFVFGLIWALYYNSQKDLGGDSTDESGLSL